jgi:hypothetical protein
VNQRLVRWNERYGRGEETFDFEPSPPLPAESSYRQPAKQATASHIWRNRLGMH